MKPKRDARGRFLPAKGKKRRKATATRAKKQIGAAAFKSLYGRRALEVAARLRNLARTAAQRAHWSRVIRALERAAAPERNRPRRKAKPIVRCYVVGAVKSGRPVGYLTPRKTLAPKTRARKFARWIDARNEAMRLARRFTQYQWGTGAA